MNPSPLIASPLVIPLSRRGAGESLSEQCVHKIVQGIRSGRYRPHVRLGEETVARDLGVGDTHVRAAFNMLTYAGVLERRPRSGTYVRQFSLDDLREMSQVRGALEGLAARSACLRLSEKKLAALARRAERIDALMYKEPYEKQLVERLDVEFHAAIIGASDNRFLAAMIGNQQFLMDCLHKEDNSENIFPIYGHRVPSHRHVVEALRKRDPAAAEEMLRRHIVEGTEEYFKLMQTRNQGVHENRDQIVTV